MRFLFERCTVLALNCIHSQVAVTKLQQNVRRFCVLASNSHCATPNAPPATNASIASANSKNEKQQTLPVEEQRKLNIAVIGVPNAGKSTFINNIINHRICPTSSKVHTTRNANAAVHTTGHTQLIFYDTPGLVTQREIKRHSLGQSFKSAYRHAVQHADAIAVLHDVSNTWTRGALHTTVLDTLKAYPELPSFLILNKIDVLKSKRILLDLIRTLTNNTLNGVCQQQEQERRSAEKPAKLEPGSSDLHKCDISWSNFNEVFLVSSTTGSGLHDVLNHFVEMAKSSAWQYDSATFTDATPEALIVDSVRARLLDYLPQEIPYKLHSEIEYYSVEKNTIYASVLVVCPTTRIERLICGEANGKLRQITDRVTSDLVETFGQPISLTITTVAKRKEDS